MSDLDVLAELQDLDSALDQLVYRRVHLEQVVAHRRAVEIRDGLRQRLAAVRSERDALDLNYAAAERAGAQLEAKTARLSAQLRTIISPREAEALQREIDSVATERGANDEAALALLDRGEQLDAEMASLEAELAAAELVVTGAEADLAVAVAELDTQASAHRAQRGALAAQLPAELMKRYEAMRKDYQGVAVARLQGTRCTGCHLDLSRTEVEAVRATPIGQISDCPQCGRILVRAA
jgi:hypothetical protein